ncbi:sensor histidine kinase [Pseudomonas gingeri]|uniref:sensor histidine kinase n=1 Tax=Pseudomonas gingeri TaxID=117681 RepID=UPI0015A45F8B|nr:HAMP domain-containing sensor histidine kinase [Pseudomonas gingeri]NWD52463.1 HAMP domain-containing histidine kinase [Pseudomonas gingeri]NWE28763.1 HAMP domain-containing histidine kinase [Pseudomonas gingeri]NWE97200.1 HAMP domain-containing histidine kinase [Pseudomonas gingeri]
MNLTLSQRLSVVFSILLLACCGASVWLQVRASDMHEKEVVQGLSRDLARSIALENRLVGTEGLTMEGVRALFGQLMNVNPSVEVYLLDPGGRITGDAAPQGHLKRDHVDLRPIQRLLDDQPLPILGDDPRSNDGRKVFSAAALQGGGKNLGYLYVVLQGEEHDRLAARVSASSVLRTTLWAMTLVALLGLIAGLIAFRLITRPLRRLTDTMRDFDTDVPPARLPVLSSAGFGSRDEIEVLEASFAQMATRIGEQWRTLTQLDQDRRELVANISHDLRTPLASLHGYLETLSLKDGVLAVDERRRYLGIALAQSNKVGKLAQALFELARLEHGAVRLEREDFSLSDLIQDVFQKFELMAETRQSKLLAVLPRGASMVSADLGMIERVLTNLIDNALRHTPEGGTIEVALVHEAGKVQVTVSDTGPGIPAKLLENLFRRPFNHDGDRRSGGLGLLIVRRILQLHDSQVRLLSIPEKGAVFYFELMAAGD